MKRPTHLDSAYSVVRHITQHSCEALIGGVNAALAAASAQDMQVEHIGSGVMPVVLDGIGAPGSDTSSSEGSDLGMGIGLISGTNRLAGAGYVDGDVSGTHDDKGIGEDCYCTVGFCTMGALCGQGGVLPEGSLRGEGWEHTAGAHEPAAQTLLSLCMRLMAERIGETHCRRVHAGSHCEGCVGMCSNGMGSSGTDTIGMGSFGMDNILGTSSMREHDVLSSGGTGSIGVGSIGVGSAGTNSMREHDMFCGVGPSSFGTGSIGMGSIGLSSMACASTTFCAASAQAASTSARA